MPARSLAAPGFLPLEACAVELGRRQDGFHLHSMRENEAVAVDGFIRKLRNKRQGQIFAFAFADLHRDAVQYVESGFERMGVE